MKIGDRVRITALGKYRKRTGIVVELPGFPFRDHRRVRLDPTPDGAPVGRARLFPLKHLLFVEHTGQLDLLLGATPP